MNCYSDHDHDVFMKGSCDYCRDTLTIADRDWLDKHFIFDVVGKA